MRYLKSAFCNLDILFFNLSLVRAFNWHEIARGFFSAGVLNKMPRYFILKIRAYEGLLNCSYINENIRRRKCGIGLCCLSGFTAELMGWLIDTLFNAYDISFPVVRASLNTA